MADEQVIVHRDVDPVYEEETTVATRTTRPSGGETLRRVIVFIFALIQGLILLRIVLLLLNAQEGNPLVDFVYSASSIFVGPFEGILSSDAIAADASVLDIAAVVAFVGWTILEFILLALVGIFRREPA